MIKPHCVGSEATASFIDSVYSCGLLAYFFPPPQFLLVRFPPVPFRLLVLLHVTRSATPFDQPWFSRCVVQRLIDVFGPFRFFFVPSCVVRLVLTSSAQHYLFCHVSYFRCLIPIHFVLHFGRFRFFSQFFTMRLFRFHFCRIVFTGSFLANCLSLCLVLCYSGSCFLPAWISSHHLGPV